jgi:flagellar motor switch protein FliN/FliY
MSDKLPQEDLDNKLEENSKEDKAVETAKDSTNPIEPSGNTEGFKHFDSKELDIVEEINNLFTGTASTTFSTLFGNTVEIKTSEIKEVEKIESLFEPSKDCVFVEINYTKGLEGNIAFIFKLEDTAVMADLMMGGDGKIEKPEIGELQLSAIGESMNQMFNASSGSLSSLLNTPITIAPPSVEHYKKNDKLELDKYSNEPVIAVFFSFKIGELVNSELIQVMPISVVKNQISKLTDSINTIAENVKSSVKDSAQPEQVKNIPSSQKVNSLPGINNLPNKPITVQPVQFTSFDNLANVYGESGKNLDLLMDVKLMLIVELGRSEMPIKKVLELTRGSIIELNKVAGEPVELYANSKLIAKGEVVVIEDNFGLRITSIVTPENRVKNL